MRCKASFHGKISLAHLPYFRRCLLVGLAPSRHIPSATAHINVKAAGHILRLIVDDFDFCPGDSLLVETAAGKCQSIVELPGFARGLSIIGPYAFIGLSKIREKSAMTGVPLAERREHLKCGVAVVDLGSGRLSANDGSCGFGRGRSLEHTLR